MCVGVLASFQLSQVPVPWEPGVSITLHNTLDEPIFVTVRGAVQDKPQEWLRMYAPAEQDRIVLGWIGDGTFGVQSPPVIVRGATNYDVTVFCYQTTWDHLWNHPLQSVAITRDDGSGCDTPDK